MVNKKKEKSQLDNNIELILAFVLALLAFLITIGLASILVDVALK